MSNLSFGFVCGCSNLNRKRTFKSGKSKQHIFKGNDHEINKLKRRMDEQSENFNKGLENMKNQTKLKNTRAERKNTLEGIHSRVDGTEGFPGSLAVKNIPAVQETEV